MRRTAGRRTTNRTPWTGSAPSRRANLALTRAAMLVPDGTHDPRRRRRADAARDIGRCARGGWIPGRLRGGRARGADPLPGRAPGPRPPRPDAPGAVGDRGLPDHPGRVWCADRDADGE